MLFCVGLTLVIAGGIGGGREATAQPQPPAAAGLLVELDDGSVVSACVALDNPFGITAAELLERSGLGVQIGAYDYGSRAVCQLAGTGCDIAQGEPCFCALDDDPTASRMWLDYRQDAGGWQAAWPRFIDRRRVLPGEVEAWVWGSPGDANGVGTDRPTSPLTFEQICAELLPTATATATPTATTTATTMPTDTATTEPLPATSTTGVEAPPAQPSPIIFPVPSATPRPTPSVAPTPTPSATPQLARSPTSAPTIEPAAQGEQIRIFLPLVAGVPEQSLGSSVAVTPPATPAPTVGPTASATPDLTMTAASAARATEAILQTEFALAPVAAAPPNTTATWVATWVRRTPTAALDLPTDRPITQYPLQTTRTPQAAVAAGAAATPLAAGGAATPQVADAAGAEAAPPLATEPPGAPERRPVMPETAAVAPVPWTNIGLIIALIAVVYLAIMGALLRVQRRARALDDDLLDELE